MSQALRRADSARVGEERVYIYQAGTTSEQHGLPASIGVDNNIHPAPGQMPRLVDRVNRGHVPGRYGQAY